MEKINISKFKELILDRLNDPQQYKGKSLILWDYEFTVDGIISKILKKLCNDYNTTHPDNVVGIRLSDLCFMKDDYTRSETICNVNIDGRKPNFISANKGIILGTGACMKTDIENLCEFINTHKNNKGPVSDNWSIVTCILPETGFTHEMFGPNCEIYQLDFNAEEWGEIMANKYHDYVLLPAISYIKENGFEIREFYWSRALGELQNILIENNINQLSKLSKEDFDNATKYCFGTKYSEGKKLMDKFYDFITKQ